MIAAHREWHQGLTILTQDRKEAIDAWKAKKKLKQEQTLLEMEAAEKVRSRPSEALVARTRATDAYRTKQAADLRQYKSIKAQKELDEAKAKRRIEAKSAESDATETRRRDEIKENLVRYQLEKEATSRVREREKLAGKRRPPSKEQLDQLRLRGEREQRKVREARLVKEQGEAATRERIQRAARYHFNPI